MKGHVVKNTEYQQWLKAVGDGVKRLAAHLNFPNTRAFTNVLGINQHDGQHLAVGDSMLKQEQWVYAFLYFFGLREANPTLIPHKKNVSRGEYVNYIPRAWSASYLEAWIQVNRPELERFASELRALRSLRRILEPSDTVEVKPPIIKAVHTKEGAVANPTEVGSYDIPLDQPLQISTFMVDESFPESQPSVGTVPETTISLDLAQLMGAFGLGLQQMIQQAAQAALRQAAEDAVDPIVDAASASIQSLNAAAARLSSLVEQAMETGDATLDNEVGSLARRLTRQLRTVNDSGARAVERIQDRFRQELTGLYRLLAIILDLADSPADEDDISYLAGRLRELIEAAVQGGDRDLQEVFTNHGQAISDALPWIRQAAEPDASTRKRNMRIMTFGGKSKMGGQGGKA